MEWSFSSDFGFSLRIYFDQWYVRKHDLGRVEVHLSGWTCPLIPLPLPCWGPSPNWPLPVQLGPYLDSYGAEMCPLCTKVSNWTCSLKQNCPAKST